MGLNEPKPHTPQKSLGSGVGKGTIRCAVKVKLMTRPTRLVASLVKIFTCNLLSKSEGETSPPYLSIFQKRLGLGLGFTVT
jgi:hypothetical protein